MSLAAGTRFGPYEIRTILGAGGMGEVYRALDTRLEREVAVKILPAAFTGDRDRLSRFEREARVLASLNHPNIGAIYGLEESGDVRAIVLELVDGETLADRIRRGPMPLGEALRMCRGIADGLDAAHEKGIVHRDLKPANIQITHEGVVKILDFGLAKAAVADASGSDPSQSPTVTDDGTRAGTVLGTAAYMSPEQARGRPVDKRTDIWSFGCVLYEMLTGRRAFPGETVSDTIAGILEREPDWSALPRSTPDSVVRLLQRCIEKDRKRRLRDIGDLRLEEDATTAPIARRDYRPWLLAAVLAILLVVALVFRRNTADTPITALPTRTTILLPDGYRLTGGDGAYPLAISPDGSRLAFVGEQEGRQQIFVREMNDLAPKPLAGTAGAAHPFFSPDGEWIGYFAGGTLRKISLAGGVPLTVCTVPGRSAGASWGSDNTIIFAIRRLGLFRVNAAGGNHEAIAGASSGLWPEILPGGKTVLFISADTIATVPLAGGQKQTVAKLSTSTPPGPGILGAGQLAQARYVPDGYLVYGQAPGVVRVLPFDLAALAVRGSPIPLLDTVERAANNGGVYFAVSASGTLVFASTGERHQLVWVDRSGNETLVSSDRAAFREPVISPDGTRIVVAINDEARRSDLWLYDTVRGTKSRLTNTNHNLAPVWSPDGAKVMFGNSSITEMSVDGSGRSEVLVPPDRIRYPQSWSPDGKNLLFQTEEPHGYETFVQPRGGEARRLFSPQFHYTGAKFSPDGRWVALTGNDSGIDQVMVTRFPELDSKYTISPEAGFAPKWSRDGHEIFYRQGDALMAVTVNTTGGFRAEKPRRLFAGAYNGASRDPQFDVAPGGKKFVMVKSDEAATLTRLVVVQNWPRELERRVPAK